MQRFHEDRQKALEHGRVGLECTGSNVLMERIIQDEINSLLACEHVSTSELNEAIESLERFREEVLQEG
ncbi:unnamed protein product [Gongylonema pulchrum]|uniref:CopG family transcriptional regulator n=1 Tax=Gongylonema pulchrum TaxID=637853 RepID=A0A183EFQ4_9BILA|nr:unnamed protein product [Gongylonema pulchrum]